MNVSRRFFLAGAGAFGAFGAFNGCRLMPGFASGKPKLKFGVVSDVHVRLSNKGVGLYEPNDTKTFIHTLEWFRDQGVDAVMIAGDIADHGMVKEMEAVAAAWFKVFPNDKAPDGRTVTRLFVCGNHDWEGFNYGKFAEKVFPDSVRRAKEILRTDYKGNWERIWHEAYAPVWMKTVNGYSFIGGHWSADKCRGKEELGIVGVPEFFAAHAKELDPSRPFFYFQHPHPKNTCYGSEAWGRDIGTATKALSPFSNAIAFSGHSHYTLTDERSVWQGAFTSIGTASLRYTCHFPISQNKMDDCKFIVPKQSTFDNRQGMLVSVYDDQVAIQRRDFVRDASLGSDWVMPLPVAENKPFAFATRAAALGTPAFSVFSKVVAAKTTQPAKDAKAKPTERVKLDFPSATATQTRAFEYEITIEGKNATGATKAKSCRIEAFGYHRSPTDKEAVGPQTCSFARAGLPAGATDVRFTVTPLSSHGLKGKPLVSNWVAL